MPYVMVPVPEEHVKEAMEAVLRISARASITDWDAAAVAELFGAVDEVARSVLSAVARSVISKGPIPDAEVAASIEISQREVLGVVRELNELAAQKAHPALVGVQQISEMLPNGRVIEQRVLTMIGPISELVRSAEKAELEAAPHPLAGGVG